MEGVFTSDFWPRNPSIMSRTNTATFAKVTLSYAKLLLDYAKFTPPPRRSLNEEYQRRQSKAQAATQSTSVRTMPFKVLKGLAQESDITIGCLILVPDCVPKMGPRRLKIHPLSPDTKKEHHKQQGKTGSNNQHEQKS